jgi:hypothetical protein
MPPCLRHRRKRGLEQEEDDHPDPLLVSQEQVGGPALNHSINSLVGSTDASTYRLDMEQEPQGEAFEPSLTPPPSPPWWADDEVVSAPAGAWRIRIAAVKAEDGLRTTTLSCYTAALLHTPALTHPQAARGWSPPPCTLQTLQDPILLTPWLCFRGQTPCQNPSPYRASKHARGRRTCVKR